MKESAAPAPSKDVRSRRRDAVFLGALLAVSLALNLALGWKIREIRTAPFDSATRTGVVLSAIKVTDLDGRPQTVDFSLPAKATVLYILHPSCGWCFRNMKNIEALANSRGESYRYVG